MRKTVSPFYLPIALLTLLWIAIPSCLHDNFPEEEPGIIVVSLDGVSTRAAGDLITDDDATIDKVRIFVFVGGLLEKNILFISGNDNFTNPFVLEVATGIKDVYVVANESDLLTPVLGAINSKSGLMAVMADQISSPLAPPLLMTGSASSTQVEVKSDPDRNKATVTLTRVAAKISLSFKKNTDANVNITQVSLLNNTGKTPIWEGEAIVGAQSYWNLEYPYTQTIPLTDNAQPIGTFYLYENLTGGNKENATQLEVEALYNNIPTRYRVYINENVSSAGKAGDPSSSITNPADHLYSIKRNYAYQLTGTIVNMGEFEGLTLTTNVLPWQKLSSEVVFDRTWEISPTPTPENRIYIVGGEGKVSFTFKLTNPIDASWIANLSNPTDFELVAPYQGKTDEEVIITVRAKESPGAEERTTEFYINVGYGENWAEIPILSGSLLIGEGNRVIIKQPANP